MSRAPAASAAVHYRVEVADLHAHLFRITLTLASPAAQQELRLPVWIPGSYLVREFSKNLQKLQCHQGKRSLAAQQTDKATWMVDCQPGQALQVQYEVYAFDNSVRTAWLDATRGFFNGTSLFLRAIGCEALPHQMELLPVLSASDWSVATGLTPLRTNSKGFGSYSADDYDTLVDCPVEMGPFWSGSFEAYGIPHRFVVAGAPPSFDGAQLLADTQAICEAEIRFWHGDSIKNDSGLRKRDKGQSPIPFKNYVFMLNAVHDGYGGLEHRNSTALICTRKDLPRLPRTTLAPTAHKQPEGYTTLLGLISHEYFHTWNVKRLRPAEFARYDYTQENYTQLLWFFEGFTSYYDDLLLRRAKRIDHATYLKLITKTINQVQQTPGRLVQTVAQASFDAWVKYYRQDENTANATVSYYTKGSLVAMCLDLTLRAEGKTTLDDVMRALWQRCAGGPMAEADLLAVLQTLAGRSYAKELARWVHSTAELPLAELLEQHGLQVHREPDQVAQQLGLRVKESGGVFVQQVLRGGVAEKAGFASGDEWIAVEMPSGTARGPWRLQTLDELTLYSGKAKTVKAIVVRDKRLLTLNLAMPKPSTAVRLSVRDGVAAGKWLDGTN
ncbi:M61 family metallopeptidase [Rhodoferax saidenbachensis]|uniref:Peptidase M61 n=1 Tax=Rhodoferax saidenbachensis TaxID=1484693 RepID=A0A1P8KDM4_9BURK|nr:M61 family metallopeptidase [Rhodoferax saidenbachensis]APW44056.1 peptidase M61 [Rhodoferax saidenbachensis]